MTSARPSPGRAIAAVARLEIGTTSGFSGAHFPRRRMQSTSAAGGSARPSVGE
jgi:hypothetical protein